MAVIYRVTKGFGQRVVHAQGLHRSKTVIQRVGVVAGGINIQRTVATRRARLGFVNDGVVRVHIRRCGQVAFNLGVVFGNAGRRGCHRGSIVGAVDGDGQGVGDYVAISIGDGIRKCFGQ